MDERTQKSVGFNLIRGVWSRRKWLAILLFALSFSFAGGLAVFLPNLYRSTATILVENQLVSETFVKSSVTSESETRLDTISQKILGRSRLEDLINRFGLYPDLRAQAPLEEVVEQMRRDIKLELRKVDLNTGRGATIAFTINYLGWEPQTAAQVTNALAAFYVEENQNFRKEQAIRTAKLLQGQLQDLKKQLNEQERRINSFKKEHSTELLQQTGANMTGLGQLTEQLRINNDRLTRALERRTALAKQLVEMDASAPISDPGTIAVRLIKLNEELRELRISNSDKHPDVVRVKKEIASLERHRADIMKADGKPETALPKSGDPTVQLLRKAFNDVDSEIKALKKEEEHLEKEMAVYQRRIENAPKREQELQEIAPDYLTIKEQYATLLKRYQEAQFAEGMEQQQQSGEEFRILDPAIPAVQPAGPNRTRLLLFGLMASLGMAVSAIVLAERLDGSFHTVDELRAFTKVPVLVVIPKIVTTADNYRRWRRFLLGCLLAMAGLALIVAICYFIAVDNKQLVLMLVHSRP